MTLEGIEASGKTTLQRGLVARLRERGVEVLATREPGGTPAGDRLRELFLDPRTPLAPLTELFVVCAARAEHVASVIRPALEEGLAVVCDRFADASVAYQGYGRGLDRGMVRACSDAASAGLRADLTLLIDLPPERSGERVAERLRASGAPVDRLEGEDEEFHRRVRAGYLAIAREEPRRFRVLDGTLPAGALLDAAWLLVAGVLAIGAKP